jgi:DNA-binding response OmpR family regulator
MNRPCFLVIDREFPGSISTRKLVIETAKFNVLTAYSGREALDTFKRFPGVDGIVMDAEHEDVSSEELVKELKAVGANVPVIVICPPGLADCPSADFVLESFQPGKLLDTLRQLKPKEAEEIAERSESINREKLK